MARKELHEVDALRTVLTALTGLDAKKQQWVLATATSNLGLTDEAQPRRSADQAERRPTAATSSDGTASPKEFLRLKAPKSDVQRVLCLGYYLANFRDTPHFKTTDLTALNVEAAGYKIGNPAQAVANATKQSHYLAAAGAGKKQVTALGEDVVGALPDQDRVKQLEAERPKRRAGKRSGRTRTSKGSK